MSSRLLVIDTNGLVAGLVLLRPGLARLHGLNEQQIDTILTELTANALWREPEQDRAESAPDPGDDHLWALLANETEAILVDIDVAQHIAAERLVTRFHVG